MALTPEQIRGRLQSHTEKKPVSKPLAESTNGRATNGRNERARGWPAAGNGSNGGRQSTITDSGQVSRVMPHSVEAEQGILGSMMISAEAIAEVVERLGERSDYFHVPAHQVIYGKLVEVWNSSHKIDLITFTQALRDSNQLETVGGVSFISSIYTFVPTAANVMYYVEIVREKFLLRQLIQAGTEAVRRGYEEQDEVQTVLDQVEQKFINLGNDRFQANAEIPIKDSVMEALELMERASENRGKLIGLSTGLAEMDRITGGLQKSNLVVIAGRPSMGKTALAMNIAEAVSVDQNMPVAVFSLEMSRQQLVQRFLCSRGRVNAQKAMNGILSQRDFPALMAAASRISAAPIYIDDSPSLPILELRAKARRMRSRHNISLVVVDYLQLLRSASKRAQDNRQLEISEISAGLKALSKELDIPIIVLAQLNRQPEARHGGKPRLSDLRESGSIEQDADQVMLIVRPEIYEDDEDARNAIRGLANVHVAKNRNGPVGEFDLTFIHEFVRFEDRARLIP